LKKKQKREDEKARVIEEEKNEIKRVKKEIKEQQFKFLNELKSEVK